MEEEDIFAYNRQSAMANDRLALNYSRKAGADAGNLDLVGKLKTLSFSRKKLMTKYFNLEEVESGSLLSEYFAVTLAFVALGVMIREANVRIRRKDIDNSDGVSPKLRRMAVDSMLKSAMERLRGLVLMTQTLKEKARDRSCMEEAFQLERLGFLKRISGLEASIFKHEATIAKYEATIANNVEKEVVWLREKNDFIERIADVDAQRAYFFKRMAEAEASLGNMQRLRMEDGKANAKLVEIYAGREQSWKCERIKMSHQIEVLEERLSNLQLKSQMKSPGFFDAAAEALRQRNLERRPKETVREKVFSEREFAAEQTRKSEVDFRSSKESFVSGDVRKDLEGADSHELSAALNQEMEAELAIILMRVGALKRRGDSGGKLDKLLSEAKGEPKLKRLGSFEHPPRSMLVDDTFLCLSESNNLKDVEVDEVDGTDIWQATEIREGNNVQRRNGFVGDVASIREPKHIGLVVPERFIQEKSTTPESHTSQHVTKGLAFADHDRAPVDTSVLDFTGFIQEKPKSNALEKSIISRTPEWLTVIDNERVLERVAQNSNLASQPTVLTEGEPSNSYDGGCEEFFKDNPSTPENNISERGSCENSIQKRDVLEESINERTLEESTIADYDRATRNIVGNSIDQLEKVHGHLLSGSLEQTQASALEIDMSAESGNCGEIPGVSLAHDPVERSAVLSLELPEDDIQSKTVLSNPTSPFPPPVLTS